MANGITQFEDLECWKEARKLVDMVNRSTGKGVFSKNFVLKDQIRRAALSVMANIAEGFGSFSNPEFMRFLKMAARSGFEVQSHLYVAKDADYINQETFSSSYEQAKKCVNLIRGLIRYLRNGEYGK